MNEIIKLLEEYLKGQNKTPFYYEETNVDKGLNFDTIVTYDLIELNKNILIGQVESDIMKKIIEYLFNGNEVIVGVSTSIWDSEKYYYFVNSRGAKKYVTDLYYYLQQKEYITLEEFITDVFRYDIYYDQNGNVEIHNILLQQLIEILKRLECKQSQINNSNINELIEEFKSLISPNNEKMYEETQKRFDDICNILKLNGCKIMVNNIEYYDFSPIKLRLFAYDKIRSSIIKRGSNTGCVSWQSRRDFINNNMKFLTEYKILSNDIVKELKDINFTNVNDNNLDQTLCDIINFIEKKLKQNKKYIDLNECDSYASKSIVKEILTPDLIKTYRSKLQCFRHHSSEYAEKRKKISEDEKRILIAYGHSICMLIKNIEINKESKNL